MDKVHKYKKEKLCILLSRRIRPEEKNRTAELLRPSCSAIAGTYFIMLSQRRCRIAAA